MNRPSVALLLSVCSLAILSLASTAQAVTLTNHVVIPHGVTHEAEEHVVAVTTVAPRDTDDDGCANADDSYDGPGCSAPAPEPVATSVNVDVAPAPEPTYTSVAPAPVTSGGCPSYMAGEASSPDAVNADSGAAGCFQVIPSTAEAMGSACSDVNSSSCVAAICAAQGNDAWVAADPCGYATEP